MPKLHQKEIVRLDADEVALLLDQVEDGTNLTKGQKKYHAKPKQEMLRCLPFFWEPESVSPNV